MHSVADSAHGGQTASLRAQLLAQPADYHIDDVAAAVGGLPPNFVQKLIARNGLPFLAAQEMEHPELKARQVNAPAIDAELTVCLVQQFGRGSIQLGAEQFADPAVQGFRAEIEHGRVLRQRGPWKGNGRDGNETEEGGDGGIGRQIGYDDVASAQGGAQLEVSPFDVQPALGLDQRGGLAGFDTPLPADKDRGLAAGEG